MANTFLANLRHLIFKIFWGTMLPDPPSSAHFLASVNLPQDQSPDVCYLNQFYVIYLKIQHDIKFDNLLVSHSYSVRVSIYLIIRRKCFNVLLWSQKVKYFFHPCPGHRSRYGKYGPRSGYGFLRTACQPIRIENLEKPYNKMY